jgi:hypothetical protein
MLKNKRRMSGACVLALALLSFPLAAQDSRKAWAKVAPPVIQSIEIPAENPSKIVVAFDLITGDEGADRASVDMIDASGAIVKTNLVGRSSKTTKKTEFAPEKSGRYSFQVKAIRSAETAQIASDIRTADFSLPLDTPVLDVFNLGEGRLQIQWTAVREAEGFRVRAKNAGTGETAEISVASGLSTVIAGLETGQRYEISLIALRGSETKRSPATAKTVRKEKDRVWNFTWFGQSSNGSVNTIEMLDADNLKFRLNSCAVNEKGDIESKGGKYTTFHDGISYYYTVIDPAKENFTLSATFTIDYINPVADGQEGFGIIAMDSLGQPGVNTINHYTNSAGIIATKFEETIGGVKHTSKDTLGARFVSGITPDVLRTGDSGIAANGTSVSRAFSYDSSLLIKKGNSYRLTLKKTNTGYHAIYESRLPSGDAATEYVMYRPDKLLQLDKDRVYVGFSVARGCNATVSDVSLVTTDPATDPPALDEPPELVPLIAKVDSPATWHDALYPFAFVANADGTLNVIDGTGKPLVQDAQLKASADFTATFNLAKGNNDFRISFTRDPAYKPGPGQDMAVWNAEEKKYVMSTQPVAISLSVVMRAFDQDTLYVTPDGSSAGNGTKEQPLSLDTAIQFCKPGQRIILAGGEYRPQKGVVIARGNSGTPERRKTIQSAGGERAILDFSGATAGMVVWGDYWTIRNIDVCKTTGNVKGLQIGGDNTIVEGVKTYDCGDTGLQISGMSSEPVEKWPANNLILNCTSYNNNDPAQNNADGFAAKLTCGNGNVFRGCIAYSNIDDGWDLFSKIERGPIGPVTIESCVSYKNGSLVDGTGNGDGNGFKLGGDGIAVAHVLKNSIAFCNGSSGITSNSDPSVIIENCTSFANAGANVNLYGKGNGLRLFKAANVISMKGGTGDVYREMPELASENNYFWNGATSNNKTGTVCAPDIFVSIDTATVPGRKADGSIDMKGFLELNGKAPKGAGAVLR